MKQVVALSVIVTAIATSAHASRFGEGCCPDGFTIEKVTEKSVVCDRSSTDVEARATGGWLSAKFEQTFGSDNCREIVRERYVCREDGPTISAPDWSRPTPSERWCSKEP